MLVTGPFNRNVDKREMVSAGAAAGIAAAFGAPIGGVLFSLEEACSVWSGRVAWRCFVASSVAVFTHSQLNPHALSGLLSVSLRPMTPWQWLQQLPALVAVSIGGGLLGAAFNKLRMLLRPLRAKPTDTGRRIAEVAAVAALTASTVALLSATAGRWGYGGPFSPGFVEPSRRAQAMRRFPAPRCPLHPARRCLPVPEVWLERPVWVQHGCQAGQYNDLATLWLQPAGRLCMQMRGLKAWHLGCCCCQT
jgi:chloride channel 7